MTNWRIQVVLNRLRMGHIGVQAYLNRFHMSEEATCQQHTVCQGNEEVETIEHFIFRCPAYNEIRANLMTKLSEIGIHNPTLSILLLGSAADSHKKPLIMENMSEFLRGTGRIYDRF